MSAALPGPLHRAALGLCVAAAACTHHAPPAAPISSWSTAGDDVVLFRDAALVRQHVDIAIGPSRTAVVPVRVAAGVGTAQLAVIDRGGLSVRGVHAAANPGLTPAPSAGSAASHDDDDDSDAGDAAGDGDAAGGGDGSDAGDDADGSAGSAAGASPEAAPLVTAQPGDVRLDVVAPRPGHYQIVIAYLTDRIRWDAAYTMMATPRRDRAQVRGALAIRNATGIALHAHVRLVDSEVGAWRAHGAEQLATDLAGLAGNTTAIASARDLGPADLVPGETRVELLAGSASRAMKSVLVYDPVGTKLDNPSGQPVRDPSLGTAPSTPRLTESFEVTRDDAEREGLPAGPVRLLERRPDGSLAVLGESRLFDASSRTATVDTIALGTADGVTGHREQRELTVDEDNKRVVEEIAITIDNKRDVPADVLLREHMYRGLEWTLAYYSVASATKEGTQQIALRTTVPPHSQQKVLYVVVYSW